MTPQEVMKLQNGDEVKWNDPDNGLCSRVLKIAHIELGGIGNGSIANITTEDGDYIEVFANELE